MTNNLLAWLKMNGAVTQNFKVNLYFQGNQIIIHEDDTVTLDFKNLMYIPLITDIKEVK